jgi:hypothetical protein
MTMARTIDQHVRELIGSLGVENCMLKHQLESAREELAMLRKAVEPEQATESQELPAIRSTRMNGNPKGAA